jgi:peptidoglycan hydrolase-like protein with peptidoglycan-binding domain
MQACRFVLGEMRVKISASLDALSLAFAFAACVALASPNANAQSGTIQRGVEAQADPAYEAARRWFEGLPAPERRAIQDALVWTGDYNGTNDGNFGKRTRDAIAAFAVRVKKPAYGTLDDAAKAALFAAADKARAAVGFAVLTDQRTRIRIGVPQKLLTKSRPSGTGTISEAADGSANLSTDVAVDADLPALYGRLTAGFPAGRPTYKLLRPDFLVVTGENAGRTIYTRYTRGAIDGRPTLRGFSLTYPAGAKATYDSVAIAIANSFDPFPGPIAATATPAPATANTAPQLQPANAAASVPTGIVVGSGMVLTSFSACANPAVGGRPALTRKRDEASGLTLLEVAGLDVRAVSVGSDGGAEVLVLSFAPSLQAGAPGKVPAPMLQVGSGRLQQGGGKTRVAAGLQQAGAGAAIFSRGGSLLGLAMLPANTANTAPRLVAGIVPESTYPLAMATEMVASGGATGGPSDKTAGEVLASIRAGLLPVTCAATP